MKQQKTLQLLGNTLSAFYCSQSSSKMRGKKPYFTRIVIDTQNLFMWVFKIVSFIFSIEYPPSERDHISKLLKVFT